VKRCSARRALDLHPALLSLLLAPASLACTGMKAPPESGDEVGLLPAIQWTGCPGARTFDVTDEGAVPDDALDDAPAIQAALDAARGGNRECGSSVYLPGGTYLLSSPLELHSYVRIHGDGPFGDSASKLKLTSSGFVDNQMRTMVTATASEHINISHLQLDGNHRGIAAALTESTGINGIELIGVSHAVIEHISTHDLGGRLAASDQSAPTEERDGGGAHIWIRSQEAGQGGAGAGAPSDGNLIQHCDFDDRRFVASFAVRLTTSWSLPKCDADYETRTERNRILDSTFTGFHWNAVEVAGPATIANEVARNTFTAARLTPLDADKGAKDNDFHHNTVDGISVVPNNPIAAGIRDQGRPCSQGAPARIAERNRFRHNTIRDIDGNNGSASDPNRIAAGILLSKSRDAVLDGNSIEGIRGVPTAYGIVNNVFTNLPLGGPTLTNNSYNGADIPAPAEVNQGPLPSCDDVPECP
jgi:Pectate lyase superfamily protein/Right handed beta helix region